MTQTQPTPAMSEQDEGGYLFICLARYLEGVTNAL